jgi:hypothetical protein
MPATHQQQQMVNAQGDIYPQRRIMKNPYSIQAPPPHMTQKPDLRQYNYTQSSMSNSSSSSNNYTPSYTNNYNNPNNNFSYNYNNQVVYARNNNNNNVHPKTFPLREQEPGLYYSKDSTSTSTSSNTTEHEVVTFVPFKAKAGKLVRDENSGELLVSLTCPHCQELVAYWYTREKARLSPEGGLLPPMYSVAKENESPYIIRSPCGSHTPKKEKMPE